MFTDWPIDYLTDWLLCRSAGRLIGWRQDGLTDWLDEGKIYLSIKSHDLFLPGQQTDINNQVQREMKTTINTKRTESRHKGDNVHSKYYHKPFSLKKKKSKSIQISIFQKDTDKDYCFPSNRENEQYLKVSVNDRKYTRSGAYYTLRLHHQNTTKDFFPLIFVTSSLLTCSLRRIFHHRNPKLSTTTTKNCIDYERLCKTNNDKTKDTCARILYAAINRTHTHNHTE